MFARAYVYLPCLSSGSGPFDNTNGGLAPENLSFSHASQIYEDVDCCDVFYVIFKPNKALPEGIEQCRRGEAMTQRISAGPMF